ncbi:CDP-alcohol phosphatidyltransferase family protein [soil metagenome]
MKKHIPNFLTCLNLFCGCVATVLIFRNHLEWAGYLVILAAIFDLFDGMAARILKVSSPIGKELDSLADLISFGFVPGAMLFKLLQVNVDTISDNEMMTKAIQFLPFILTVFSAIRLAKFNLDTRQTDSFIGLPTPASTLFVIALPLILSNDNFGLSRVILNPYFILGISSMMSFLLVAELPLIALKFKTLSWKENSYQFILIIASAILLVVLKFAALPVIIVLYVLLSFIKNRGKETSNS